MNPENEINITYVHNIDMGMGTSLCTWYGNGTSNDVHDMGMGLCDDNSLPIGINMGSLLSITPVFMVMEVLSTFS